MLPATQVGARQARHASGDTDRSRGRLTRDRLIRAAEHGFHRTGESDGPTWNSCAGSAHLGYGAAVSTPISSPGMVAGLLPFCASSPLAASSAHAATRA